MREFIVENLTNQESISISVVLLNNIVSMVMAFVIMFTYKITYSGTAYSKKFNISLGAITFVTTMIMAVISNNVALSLGMVGALSIIRFRTAVKDVRDAAFIFWAIAVGIGCGVAQYTLIGMGSIFLFVFFYVTKSIVASGKMLLIVSGKADMQNRVEVMVDEHFAGKAKLTVKNVSADTCEMIYVIGEDILKRANENKALDISQSLMKIKGVERVNQVEQQDDIAR